MAATIILYATPFFFVLIAIELMVDAYRKTGYYRINDSITSLALGIISRTHRFIVFGFAVGVYAWVAKTLAVTQFPADSWPVWIFSFILSTFVITGSIASPIRLIFCGRAMWCIIKAKNTI